MTSLFHVTSNVGLKCCVVSSAHEGCDVAYGEIRVLGSLPPGVGYSAVGREFSGQKYILNRCL